MDAGLLLAGVSTVVKPPGAPPGKDIETPPAKAKNEFKDVLKQAEGKSSGEVAEAEPNAQPQKLDSTEEPTDDKAQASKAWTELLGLAVISSPVTVPTDAMAVVQVSAPLPTELISLDPEKASVEADSSLISPTVAQVLNVVEISAKQSRLDSAQVQQRPEFQTNLKPELVQSLPQQTASMIATPSSVATSTTVGQSLTEKNAEKIVGSEVVESGGSEGVSVFTDVVAEVTSQPESGFGGNPKGHSDSNFNGQQQASGQTEVKAVSSETTQKVEQSMAMTPAERKAVVHQLTQKIEALAVNSVRNEVTVRMEPAELGTVLVQVTRGMGELTASLSANNKELQTTLHEAKNELAAALTAKTNATVKVEVISAESTPMGPSNENSRHSSPQNQPRQEALTKFYEARTTEPKVQTTTKPRLSHSLIDLES